MGKLIFALICIMAFFQIRESLGEEALLGCSDPNFCAKYAHRVCSSQVLICHGQKSVPTGPCHCCRKCP